MDFKPKPATNKPLSENSALLKPIYFIEKQEWLYALILVLLILVFTLNQQLLQIPLIIVLSFFSVVYFISSFRPLPVPDSENKELIFIVKLSGLSTAISGVGIQFGMLDYAGSGRMVLGGFLSSVVCLLFTAYFLHIKKIGSPDMQSLMKRFIYRALFVSAITAVFWFVPEEKLVEVGVKMERVKGEGH